MTFKKTITISIVLHICFFSAAILFSAGLMRGRGDLSDQKVLFITLSENQDRSGDHKTVSAAPESRAVKKDSKPVVIEKGQVAKAEIVVEKTEEPVSESNPSADMNASATVDDQHVFQQSGSIDNELNDSAEDREMIQASHEDNASAGRDSFDGGAGSGLLPGTIELIKNAIERVKTYPVIARRRGIEGTVHVSFSINPEGRPHDIMVMKSSGFNILDRATVNVVIKAAPYPFIASRVELPVAYRLEH